MHKWCLLPLLLLSVVLAGPEPDRVITIPASELPRLLQLGADRVLLPETEFERMKREVLLAKQKQGGEVPAFHSPVQVDVTATLHDDHVWVEAECLLEGLNSDINRVQLDFENVFWVEAELEGRPAMLAGQPGGAVDVFLKGAGRQTLRLKGVSPLPMQNNRQILTFKVPEVPGTLDLLVPKELDVEESLTKGNVIPSPDLPQDQAEILSVSVLPVQGRVRGSLQLDRLYQSDPRMLTSLQWQYAILDGQHESIHEVMNVFVHHQPVTELELSLPPDVKVTSVRGRGALDWTQDPKTPERIRVSFGQEVMGPVVLNVYAIRHLRDATRWQPAPIRVVGTQMDSVLQHLKVRAPWSVANVFNEDAELYSRGGPVVFGSHDQNSDDGLGETFTWLVSPEGAGPRVEISRKELELEVFANLKLSSKVLGNELHGVVTFLPRNRRLVETRFLLPAEWRVQDVFTGSAHSRTELPFEVFDGSPGFREIRVTFPEARSAGVPVRVEFLAEHTPENWLEEGGKLPFTFPSFDVPGAERMTGALSVDPGAFHAVQVRSLNGLTPLDDRSKQILQFQTGPNIPGYRFEASGYQMELERVPVSPNVRVQSFTFLRAGEDGLMTTRWEWLVENSQAPVDTFTFVLPKPLPQGAQPVLENATLRGEVKRTRLEDGGERWNLPIVGNVEQAVRITLEGVEPIEPGSSVPVPFPLHPDLEVQSGFFAVEGLPGLHVEVTHTARPVDPGELADASYQPGTQLAGSFAYSGSPRAAAVTFTSRERVVMEETRIRRLDVQTIMAVTGKTQNEAEFIVEDPPSFFMLHVPGEEEAWSVVVDSEAVEPRRGAQNEWLIPIPSGAEGDLRTVRVVYVGEVKRPGLLRSQHLAAPRLSVYNEDGRHRDLAPLETQWRVTIPEGFRLLNSKGTAVLTTDHEPRLAVVSGVKQMISLGGGVGMPFAWLTGILDRSDRLRSGYSKYEEPLQGEGVEPLTPAADAPATSRLRPVDEVTRQLSTELDLWQGGQEANVPKPGVVRGFRSLQIQLSSNRQGIPFYGLTPDPVVTISMVRKSSLDLFGVALTVLVLLGGIRIWTQTFRAKLVYLLSVVLLSCLPGILPVLAPLDTVFNALFLGVVVVCLLFLGWKVFRFFWRIFSRPILFFVGILAGLIAYGDPVSVQPDPLPLPENIVVRVAPEQETEPVQVLIPREQMTQMQQALQSGEGKDPSESSTLGWTGGRVTGILQNGKELDVRVEYEFRLYGEEVHTVRLPLKGASVGGVTVDGRPARVRMKKEALLLQVSGEGDHEIVLQLRTPVRHVQGRHSATFTVLSVPGLVSGFTVPESGTRVEIRGAKEGAWQKVTEKDQQVVTTPVGASGSLEVTWSDAPEEGEFVNGLDVKADTGLHLFQDLVIMQWTGQMVSRGSPVHNLEMDLPSGWNVLRIWGENVSGWERDAVDTTKLSIHFLHETRREEVRMTLWRPTAEDQRTLTFQPVPFRNTLRQTGHVEVYVDPSLKASVTSHQGFQRANLMQTEAVSLQGERSAMTKLSTSPFQNYRYLSTEAALQLEWNRQEVQVSTRWQQLLKVSDQENRVEARCIVNIEGAPLHALTFEVDEGLRMERLSARGIVSWSQKGSKVVALAPSGIQGTAQIVMEGVLDQEGELTRIPAMSFVESVRTAGSWVILADPSLELILEPGSEMKRIPLKSTYSWLEQGQRPFGRLALAYEKEGAAARLRYRELDPEVAVTTYHNLRVNHLVIEETLFVEAQIRRAGLETFSIRVPSRYQDAVIQTPPLREKRFLEVPGQPEWVDLHLTFQDKLMGQLVVLLERDRSAETDRVSLMKPIVLTGREHRAFFTVENAGRDELQIEKPQGVEALSRAHSDWAAARELMGENVTFAYVAEREAEISQLEVVRVTRQQALTAGARIGLSRIEVQMDESASYIGRWTLWIDNRTEPLLHASLPEGARLIQIRVAGKEVQPVKMENGTASDVYIPLVKTARGEQDVQVQLLYAGELGGFSAIRRGGFPFPVSENIPVDLSQAELTLPKRYRWLRFDGTMKQLPSSRQLQAGWLSYQAGLTERLTQTLKSGDVFEQARAVHTLSTVSEGLQQVAGAEGQQGQQVEFAQELERATRVLREAQEEIVSLDGDGLDDGLSDNRMNFRGKFDAQANDYSRNQVFWNGVNFNDSGMAIEAESKRPGNQEGQQFTNIQSVVQSGNLPGSAQRREKSSGKKNREWFSKSRSGVKGQASKYLESLKEKELEETAPPEPREALLFPLPDMNRMTTFAFSTPRGDTRVTAITVPESWIESLIRFFSFLLILAVLQWIRKRPQGTQPRKKGWGKWMICIGLLGVVSGVLPVYSFLLFGWGLVKVMSPTRYQAAV